MSVSLKAKIAAIFHAICERLHIRIEPLRSVSGIAAGRC